MILVRLLDNNTLRPLSTKLGDGQIDNVYDVKIKQTINGVYQASMKMTPSEDAWKVQFPNIVEINSEYFRVMQVTKSRSNNIDISVDLEHISYELNKLTLLENGYQDRLETEIVYSGPLLNILQRILRGKRFTFDVSSNIFVQGFITSSVGLRTRLNELAKFIGWEIDYYRFNISFKNRIGASNGLVLEVGKNIRSLDYVITTDVGDNLTTALDVSVLDLSQIAKPEEFHQIKLGDTIRVLDPQLNVNQLERVVSLEYDPFQKALPNIEIENIIADTATASTLSQSGSISIVVFEDTVDRDIVLGNKTQTLQSEIFVIRDTYFDISSTFTLQSTSNGILTASFYLDGLELPSTYRKSIVSGWDTISISRLVFGIQPGEKNLILLLTYEGSGTCTLKYGQMITRSNGVIGGVDNNRPDRSIMERFEIGTVNASNSDILTLSLSVPMNQSLDDMFDTSSVNAQYNDNITIVLTEIP